MQKTTKLIFLMTTISVSLHCFYKIPEKIFQGSIENEQTTMRQISNSEGFIAISSSSDENDRYYDVTHPSYESRTPIDLLERSDNYGFYFSVYDASGDKFFIWPENSEQASLYDFPTPDKSLPELPLPMMIFALFILTITLVQFKSKHRFFRNAYS